MATNYLVPRELWDPSYKPRSWHGNMAIPQGRVTRQDEDTDVIRILKHLASSDEARTVINVAEALDVHRNRAQQLLKRLRACGLVDVHRPPSLGRGCGRQLFEYRLSWSVRRLVQDPHDVHTGMYPKATDLHIVWLLRAMACTKRSMTIPDVQYLLGLEYSAACTVVRQVCASGLVVHVKKQAGSLRKFVLRAAARRMILEAPGGPTDA